MNVAAKLLGTTATFVGTGTVLAVGILAAVHHLIPADALDDEHDDADEFEGDAWDRALDQRRDESREMS